MATETVEITTMIGVCVLVLRCVFGKVWLHFVNVVDLKTLFGAKTVLFCVGQTDSKYAQSSDSRALATAKKVHLALRRVMEDSKVGPLLFPRSRKDKDQ